MDLKYDKENIGTIGHKVHNRTVSDFDDVILVENVVEKSMIITDVFTDISIARTSRSSEISPPKKSLT